MLSLVENRLGVLESMTVCVLPVGSAWKVLVRSVISLGPSVPMGGWVRWTLVTVLRWTSLNTCASWPGPRRLMGSLGNIPLGELAIGRFGNCMGVELPNRSLVWSWWWCGLCWVGDLFGRLWY